MREPVVALAALLTLPLAAGAAGADPTPERQEALRHLVAHDCGSCHGMTLKGGLGPPLTANALGAKAPEALHATIAHGRPGTPMPPWKGILTEAEIDWLVRTLRQGTFERR